MHKESQNLFKKLLYLFIIPHVLGIISLLISNVVLFIISNISVLFLIVICFRIIDKYNYVTINGKKVVSDKELKKREEKIDKFIKKNK